MIECLALISLISVWFSSVPWRTASFVFTFINGIRHAVFPVWYKPLLFVSDSCLWFRDWQSSEVNNDNNSLMHLIMMMITKLRKRVFNLYL